MIIFTPDSKFYLILSFKIHDMTQSYTWYTYTRLDENIYSRFILNDITIHIRGAKVPYLYGKCHIFDILPYFLPYFLNCHIFAVFTKKPMNLLKMVKFHFFAYFSFKFSDFKPKTEKISRAPSNASFCLCVVALRLIFSCQL